LKNYSPSKTFTKLSAIFLNAVVAGESRLLAISGFPSSPPTRT